MSTRNSWMMQHQKRAISTKRYEKYAKAQAWFQIARSLSLQHLQVVLRQLVVQCHLQSILSSWYQRVIHLYSKGLELQNDIVNH